MNVFDLYACITLDRSDYERGLSEAGEKTSSFSDKLKNGLATAAKVGGAAIAAASTAVAALTKVSLDQYGEYEQLVGGVETLFKQSADVVQKYAANAYQTAGLSANEYMSTVTSFSASLLQSLDGDTAKAAETADMAITDMSDNANKMGTSMESIQNAYQGFAKQNYTMLDNLKLGYGGTKEEMQRLLKDAENLSGIKYDISSYADIVDAIHVVQTEMGITGTTAAEASSTIQGSVSAMKSAWSNLLTGIADENASMDSLVGNFLDSVVTVGENVVPRVEQILTGIGSAIERLSPVISEAIPVIIDDVLPGLLQAGQTLLQALIDGITQNIDSVSSCAIDVMLMLADMIVSNLPQITEAGIQTILALVNGIAESSPELVPAILGGIGMILVTLFESVPDMIEAGMNLITGLGDGLMEAFKQLNPEVGAFVEENIYEPIRGKIEGIFELGSQLCNWLWEGIKSVAVKLFPGLSGILGDSTTEAVSAAADKMLTVTDEAQIAAKNATDAAGEAILQSQNATAKSLALTNGDIKTEFADLNESYDATISDLDKGKEAKLAAENTFQAFIDGMNSKIPGIMSTMQSIGNQITSSLQSGIGTVTVPVNIQTTGRIPGHATGLDFVPYDNYLAYLHKGEAVLTAAEAKAWRNGEANSGAQNTGGSTVINQYIDTVPQTPAEFAAATAAYFEQARWIM